MLRGAQHYLKPGSGRLFVYGPFMLDGRYSSESNIQFDAAVQLLDPSWGFKDIADIKSEAMSLGLEVVSVESMPANNFMLVMRAKERIE